MRETRERPQHQRQRQIKLLLDRERPGVQQRLFRRGMVEIAGLEPEEKIRGEGHHRCNRAEKLRAFGGQEIMEGRDRGQRHHGVQRRQQAAHAPLVKSRKGKRAALQFRLDDPGDQIAGDHKEDIDADKTAEHRRRLEMERDHRKHGDGAQPVDVFTIVAPHDRCAAQVRYRARSKEVPLEQASRRAGIMPRVRPS